MAAPKIFNIGILIYPNFDPLEVVGPYEIFSTMAYIRLFRRHTAVAGLERSAQAQLRSAVAWVARGLRYRPGQVLLQQQLHRWRGDDPLTRRVTVEHAEQQESGFRNGLQLLTTFNESVERAWSPLYDLRNSRARCRSHYWLTQRSTMRKVRR